MIKYRHIETGLFLQKKRYGQSTVYGLSEKNGTKWNSDVFALYQKPKDPKKFGYNQYWKREEFEIVRFNLVQE